MLLFNRYGWRSAIVFSLLVCVAPVHAQDGAADRAPLIVPPRVAEGVEPQYPPDVDALESDVVVRVQVVLGEDGAVRDAVADGSAPPNFATEALRAVRAWRFTPATRDGAPMASQIRVPITFVARPSQQAPTAPTSAPQPANTPTPREESAGGALQAADTEPVLDVTVRGSRIQNPRAASEVTLDRDGITAAPHESAANVIASAPGVYVSRGEGDAVAHEIFLRGFNAEHGQDMELSLNGYVPINQMSHLHGQGYADMNYLIPEVIESVRIVEGVYDPRQGDFAVAGSVNFDLGVRERGYQVRSSYGSFNTFRQLLVVAPEGEPEATFAAFQFRSTDGYGQNRGSVLGSAIASYEFSFPGDFQGRLHLVAYGARASIAGVLRRDDVDTGRVGFFDSYNDPSANAQSALATRAQLGVSLERRRQTGSRTSISLWTALVGFHARENFSGYTQYSRIMPTWAGRGDLHEQINDDVGLGASFQHRTNRFRPWTSVTGDVSFGLSFRTSRVTATQNLLEVPLNQVWDQRVDATIQATDVGAFVDADWNFTRYLHVRGGVRADMLHFDVDDRLGNFTPQFRPESFLQGYRRTALGLAVGPRATLEVVPTPSLRLLASYGQGFRSPQARQLEEGESAPFARVHAFEVGSRYVPNEGKRFSLTTAFYATMLSYDIAFDPEEGSLTRIGPTTRLGFVAHAIARPWKWLYLSASITTVRATLDAPPPATAENPAPAYVDGQLLPYVPPVVVRADGSATHPLFAIVGEDVVGRIGFGFSFLSARPLPYSATAPALALLDASLSLRYRFLELSCDAFNLFDSRYAASEYSFVSNWQTTTHPSLVPARHIAAGSPLTVMFNLGVTL